MTHDAATVTVSPPLRPEEPGPFGRIRRELGWLDRIPPEEVRNICAVLARLPISRNLVEVAGFVDRLWFQARNAEFRMGPGRVTGAEMDVYRERLDQAVRSIIEVTNDLARRVGMTQILQFHGRFLQRNGIDVLAPPPARPPMARPETVREST